MFGLCALPSALSNPVLYVEENSAFYRGQSLALMRCLCRPSWACFFLFLLFPYLLSATSLSPVEVKSFFSYLGFAAAPGFVHNWLTRLQQGWSGASLVSFLYPVLKLAKNRRTGASLDFLPRTSLPLPLKGEGPGIVCLGFVGFALLGHSCLTRLQQGRFGGWLVFAPYSASKAAHRATRSRVWLSPLFPRTFLLWQGC